MRLSPSFLAVAIAAASFSSVQTPASAFDREVTFCNKTSRSVDVAVAYDLSGTSEITSKGWFTTQPCSCRRVINADLRATEVFFLVTREGLENVVADARAGICVHPSDSFTYRSANASAGRCEDAGGEWAYFKMKDTGGNSSYTYSVRGEGACNLMDDAPGQPID
jgi:uncharacterized membrane protein